MAIVDNIKVLKETIGQCEVQYQRQQGSVKLLAVSKQQSVEKICQAYETGLTDFGENYLQEALEKMERLASLAITWHFIGSIQSNKTQAIASHFDWVHTVDRLKIAQRLNAQRPEAMAPLNVCIQVNLSNEATKSGVNLDEVKPLAQAIAQLPRLNLRGLMAIPAPIHEFEEQRALFTGLYTIYSELNQELVQKLDTLSMGMSHDYKAAIAAGSTCVRIGSALFGQREKRIES